MSRSDDRRNDQIRPVKITRDFQDHPHGSVLIEMGNTRVICAVSAVKGVPRWMREQGVPGGWLTSEYSMLPSATHSRKAREVTQGKPQGRTMEIQRLVGRSLRAMVDLKRLSQVTLYCDCDVINADGGTRCASITGAAVALQIALRKLFLEGTIKEIPILQSCAAVSVGIVKDEAMLDLCYEEDSAAEVDMNVVMTEDGKFIEIQGTAEEAAFTRCQSNQMLELAEKGIRQLFEAQRKALKV